MIADGNCCPISKPGIPLAPNVTGLTAKVLDGSDDSENSIMQ